MSLGQRQRSAMEYRQPFGTLSAQGFIIRLERFQEGCRNLIREGRRLESTLPMRREPQSAGDTWRHCGRVSARHPGRVPFRWNDRRQGRGLVESIWLASQAEQWEKQLAIAPRESVRSLGPIRSRRFLSPASNSQTRELRMEPTRSRHTWRRNKYFGCGQNSQICTTDQLAGLQLHEASVSDCHEASLSDRTPVVLLALHSRS